MNKKVGYIGVAAVLALVIVVVGGWYIGAQKGTNAGEESIDVKQLVQSYSAANLANVSASITSDELIIFHNNGREEIHVLPEDEFFVSIAPYIEHTHPCTYHSLTGCRGELMNVPFDVTITDSEGRVIVDETIHSLSNGFIDLWLPRNHTYEVTIRYQGKAAATVISTYSGDPTCITTMQLRDA